MLALVATFSLAERWLYGDKVSWLALPLIAVVDGGFALFARDFLPRRGSLDGTVLEVRGARGLRQCDLASAEVISLHGAVSPGHRLLAGTWSLVAHQERRGPAMRLLLRGRDLRPFPPAQLRTRGRRTSRSPGWYGG